MGLFDADMDILRDGPKKQQYFMYALEQLGYTLSMIYIGNRTYNKTVEDSEYGVFLEIGTVKTLMTLGYNVGIPVFVGPLLFWVLLTLVFKFPFYFLMRTYSIWNWIGVLAGCIIMSFLDDIGFIVFGRASASEFGLSDDAGVDGVYDAFPEYKKARWFKLIINVANVFLWLRMYPDFKQHVKYMKNRRRATKSELDSLKLFTVMDF